MNGIFDNYVEVYGFFRTSFSLLGSIVHDGEGEGTMASETVSSPTRREQGLGLNHH